MFVGLGNGDEPTYVLPRRSTRLYAQVSRTVSCFKLFSMEGFALLYFTSGANVHPHRALVSFEVALGAGLLQGADALHGLARI